MVMRVLEPVGCFVPGFVTYGHKSTFEQGGLYSVKLSDGKKVDSETDIDSDFIVHAPQYQAMLNSLFSGHRWEEAPGRLR